MLPSFSVVFPLLRNLEISTQESNANSTEISIYKIQFLTCNSKQKGTERFFIETLLQKCFKTANFETPSFHDQGVSIGNVFLILITKNSL